MRLLAAGGALFGSATVGDLALRGPHWSATGLALEARSSLPRVLSTAMTRRRTSSGSTRRPVGPSAAPIGEAYGRRASPATHLRQASWKRPGPTTHRCARGTPASPAANCASRGSAGKSGAATDSRSCFLRVAPESSHGNIFGTKAHPLADSHVGLPCPPRLCGGSTGSIVAKEPAGPLCCLRAVRGSWYRNGP